MCCHLGENSTLGLFFLGRGGSRPIGYFFPGGKSNLILFFGKGGGIARLKGENIMQGNSMLQHRDSLFWYGGKTTTIYLTIRFVYASTI